MTNAEQDRSNCGGTGRIPVAGDRFIIRTLQFDVVQASPTKVERVLIRLVPPPPVLLAPPLSEDSRK